MSPQKWKINMCDIQFVWLLKCPCERCIFLVIRQCRIARWFYISHANISYQGKFAEKVVINTRTRTRTHTHTHPPSRTHTHTHPPSRWDFLTKKRFSPGKRGRFPHRRKQLAKNVAGKGRGKEMSLSRCLGLYYKLPKSDPNAVYLLPTAVYLLQCCFIAANIVWTG